jgi:hypothetical protein
MDAKAHLEKSPAVGELGSIRPVPLHGIRTVDALIT